MIRNGDIVLQWIAGRECRVMHVSGWLLALSLSQMRRKDLRYPVLDSFPLVQSRITDWGHSGDGGWGGGEEGLKEVNSPAQKISGGRSRRL